ncbi:hypothetical protein DL96DRAFT_1752789 [Flagelloscypha sp. PMI_526]|nr:hypothetical protein DL96DRAFT_1752789 [Flagelloscypha sp. PMI_526]
MSFHNHIPPELVGEISHHLSRSELGHTIQVNRTFGHYSRLRIHERVELYGSAAYQAIVPELNQASHLQHVTTPTKLLHSIAQNGSVGQAIKFLDLTFGVFDDPALPQLLPYLTDVHELYINGDVHMGGHGGAHGDWFSRSEAWRSSFVGFLSTAPIRSLQLEHLTAWPNATFKLMRHLKILTLHVAVDFVSWPINLAPRHDSRAPILSKLHVGSFGQQTVSDGFFAPLGDLARLDPVNLSRLEEVSVWHDGVSTTTLQRVLDGARKTLRVMAVKVASPTQVPLNLAHSSTLTQLHFVFAAAFSSYDQVIHWLIACLSTSVHPTLSQVVISLPSALRLQINDSSWNNLESVVGNHAGLSRLEGMRFIHPHHQRYAAKFGDTILRRLGRIKASNSRKRIHLVDVVQFCGPEDLEGSGR